MTTEAYVDRVTRIVQAWTRGIISDDEREWGLVNIAVEFVTEQE